MEATPTHDPGRWWCCGATATEVLLGPVYAPDRCDLGFVEGLLRVQLTARRFGWSIVLRDVQPDLLELVELVGLRADLVGEAQSSEKGG